ncbi:MAG: MSCRAMM family protein, partial [Planctomycetota bacterium]
TEIQAVIPSGATVEGEVRHPETGPLSGVMLALQAHDSRDRLVAATDEAGRYRLTGVPPGIYGVSVEGKLLGRRPRHVGDLAVRGLGAVTADFVVGNVSLRGAVLDMETNQPLPGVRLVIREPDVAGTTTDEHGEYRFLDLPTGDCRLSARKDGYETRSVDVRELKAGETRHVDVALRPAAILHIYVTDAGGRPVAGRFRLSVIWSQGDRFRVQTAHVVTDEKGYARYSKIGPGTYRLSIMGARGRGHSARVEIVPGDNTVRFQLRPGPAK